MGRANPIAGTIGSAPPPEHAVLLADSIGLALFVVLETLAPDERIAFVLHDMFEVPFDEIAPIVGRSPAAARQLASRARRRVKGSESIPDADLDRQRERKAWARSPSCREATYISCSAALAARVHGRCLTGAGRSPEAGIASCCTSESLDSIITKLTGAAVGFRNEAEVGPGGRQILVDDPDGNPIELHEAP